MRPAPYCAHAGVARHTIADQTNIEMARIRMMYLAPVGYDKCAHWVERSAACWVGRVRIPCGIVIAQQKAPKRARASHLPFSARNCASNPETSRAFPGFRIDSQFQGRMVG